MPKEFNCPSCAEPITFQGGESIFQTCKACHAPVIVPSEMLYGTKQKLPSEEFASLTNDKLVDVEQVTNELTPGNAPPKDDEMIDTEAKIEKFEVYQEKIGTHAIETKKAVDEIVAPKRDADFKTASPFANIDGSISLKIPEQFIASHRKNTTPPQNSEQQIVNQSVNPVIARVKNELQKNDRVEAINILRDRFNMSLRDAKDAVEALERGEDIDVSQFLSQ